MDSQAVEVDNDVNIFPHSPPPPDSDRNNYMIPWRSLDIMAKLVLIFFGMTTTSGSLVVSVKDLCKVITDF